MLEVHLTLILFLFSTLKNIIAVYYMIFFNNLFIQMILKSELFFIIFFIFKEG